MAKRRKVKKGKRKYGKKSKPGLRKRIGIRM